MRLVVQRVEKASVLDVQTKFIVGEIGKGMLILLGVGKEDNLKEAEMMAEKITKLRIFSDEKDKMNLSIKESNGEVLVVSQFTLYADTTSGNRPSFIKAADPEKAKEIYMHFIDELKRLGIETKNGSFGNFMKITAVLDGPVTILY